LAERTLERIIKGNALGRGPVEAGFPQGSPMSPILFVIYTSGLIKWVTEYVSTTEGLSILDYLGWVAHESDVNQVVTIHEKCAAKSIEWANREVLQFNTAKMEAALFTLRPGHKIYLRPKLTPKITVGDWLIRFNKQTTRWLGVWIDAHLMFKDQHNRCMKKAMAVKARLRTITKLYGIAPETIRAVQVACTVPDRPGRPAVGPDEAV